MAIKWGRDIPKIKWTDVSPDPDPTPKPKLKFEDVNPKKIMKWKNIKPSSYQNRYNRTMKAVV